jgi:DNA-directed RNA polymerase subunit RPC12/RpoP
LKIIANYRNLSIRPEIIVIDKKICYRTINTNLGGDLHSVKPYYTKKHSSKQGIKCKNCEYTTDSKQNVIRHIVTLHYDLLTSKKNIPKKHELELPVETGELPVETGELPVETGELPVETGELPVETGSKLVQKTEKPDGDNNNENEQQQQQQQKQQQQQQQEKQQQQQQQKLVTQEKNKKLQLVKTEILAIYRCLQCSFQTEESSQMIEHHLKQHNDNSESATEMTEV